MPALPCLTLMSSLKTIIWKYILVCVFLVSPCCVHRDRRPDPTVSVVPSPRFVLFGFFKFVLLFQCFVPRGKRVRWPRALMPAVRGSLCRRSLLFHPAVRGSLCRRSRLSHPAVRGSLRCRSRLSHPAVRGNSRRRSQLSDPAVRGSWRRRWRLSHPAVRGSSRRHSRINQPTVRRRWRSRRPWLTLAHRPAAESMPAGLPLTQARRIATDSCPLVAVGGESQLATSVHAAVRGRSRRRPWWKPTHRRRLPLVRGEGQPAVRGHLAHRRLWLPPARRSPPLGGQASRLWFRQPVVAVYWPDSDQGLFKYCFVCV